MVSVSTHRMGVTVSTFMYSRERLKCSGCNVSDLYHAGVETMLVGTSADAVDVLKLSPPSDTSWNGVVAFDGRSVAVDVEQDDVLGAGGLASQFTIATWLRHKHGDDDRIKQHVMCSSDAEGRPLHVRFNCSCLSLTNA